MGKRFLVLLRRELWEHRSFIRTPIILSLVILFIFITGMLTTQTHFFERISDYGMMDGQSIVSPVQLGNVENLRHFVWIALFSSVFVPMQIVLCFIVFFYALSSLFDERRDRSILFWKSLPISNSEVVLSKVFSALITAPLITFIIVLITQLIVLILLACWGSFQLNQSVGIIWSLQLLLKTAGYDFTGLMTTMFWVFPVLGWFWLVSSWVKRGPFLVAIFIPLCLLLIERMLFDSGYFSHLISERLTGLWAITGHAVNPQNISYSWMSTGMWGGGLVALIFIIIATCIRSYKDDSY